MKRQSLVMLAVTIVAAAAGCFKDPTGSLRNGPALFSLDHKTVFLHPGDSVSVVATLMDGQGNALTATGATWDASDATIASVRKDTTVTIPGDYFTRGVILAVAPGITRVAVTARGVTDTIHITVTPLTFPGTITTGGKLLDTITFNSTAVVKFTPSGASASTVTIAGQQAFVISRTADALKVITRKPTSSAATLTNLVLGGSFVIPTIQTSALSVSGSPTGEANEPGNDTRAGATTVAFTGATDTITVYGSIDCEDDGTACPGNGDIIDYYQIAYAGGEKIRAILTWFGDGTGGASYNDTNNPDMDVLIRDAAGNLYGTGTGTNGSGLNMPEIATTTTALAAGTYYFRVLAWLTPSPVAYRLQILRTP